MRKFTLIMVSATILISLWNCKTDSKIETINKSINITFNIINSTKGKTASFSRDIIINRDNTLNINEIIIDNNIIDVDNNRAALRKSPSDNKLGSLISYTESGLLYFAIEEDETELYLYLMNDTNGVDYDCLDDHTPDISDRFAIMKRIDKGSWDESSKTPDGPVQTGPDSVFYILSGQINSALQPGNISYGSVDYQGKCYTDSAEIECGYGAGPDNSDGTHKDNTFLINADVLTSDIAKLTVGLVELFKTYFGIDDICGISSPNSLQSNGTLTLKGKDIIAYFALKNY